MSKAFTKDQNDSSSEALTPPQGPDLPAGAKNYMTPQGAAQLREELKRLLQIPAAQQKDAPRIQYLRTRLSELEIINPQEQITAEVRFGATVRIQDENGNKRTVQLVGVDEANPTQGLISWISPLARALAGAKAGETIVLELPNRSEEFEILEIRYA